VRHNPGLEEDKYVAPYGAWFDGHLDYKMPRLRRCRRSLAKAEAQARALPKSENAPTAGLEVEEEAGVAQYLELLADFVADVPIAGMQFLLLTNFSRLALLSG